jgi:hypothetical protein
MSEYVWRRGSKSCSEKREFLQSRHWLSSVSTALRSQLEEAKEATRAAEVSSSNGP